MRYALRRALGVAVLLCALPASGAEYHCTTGVWADCAETIRLAVVDQAAGGARDAVVTVHRVRGQKAWLLSEPIRIGPGWQITLRGEGSQGHPDADWGGVRLDSRSFAGPAIILDGGVGVTIENLSLVGGGIWITGDSSKAISNYRTTIRQVGIKALGAGAVGLLISGRGPLNGGMQNDQVGDNLLLESVSIHAPDGIGYQSHSKQAVGQVWIGGHVGGGVAGIDLIGGGLTVYGVNFGCPRSGAVEVRQTAQPSGFSDLRLRDTYHEIGAGCTGFQGIGSQTRPTILDGVRLYVQGAGARWIDAPGFQGLELRGVTYEQAPGLTPVPPALHPAVTGSWVRW